MGSEVNLDNSEVSITAPDTGSQEATFASLMNARQPEVFAANWLDLQCRILGSGLISAVIVLGPPDIGPFAPIAVWPKGTLGSPGLVAGIEKAMANKALVIDAGKRVSTDDAPKRKLDNISIPLLIDGQVAGAVSMEFEHRPAEERTRIIDQLMWGVGWLEALTRRNRYSVGDRLSTVLELIATGLEHERFQASATAVATEIAGVLHCERVSIGFLRGQHTQVRALSHSASFVRKANVIRAVEAAMDEAIDQQAVVFMGLFYLPRIEFRLSMR